MDIGWQDWKVIFDFTEGGLRLRNWKPVSDEASDAGHHIVRRNVIADCGICGIAGAGGTDHSLIEDNAIERIGGMDIEWIAENAGLKFHFCDGALIRRNVFRHIKYACGLWLDLVNRNCRITENVFADIHSVIGALFMEVNLGPNAIDHNVFWDIREGPEQELPYGATCVQADCNDNLTIAHNLFGKITSPHHPGRCQAVVLQMRQQERVITGRVGQCRGNSVLNNVFVNCGKRVYLCRADDNVSDGNLFNTAEDSASFIVESPPPKAILNLEGWRDYYGFDRNGSQAKIDVQFDPDSLELTWKVEGDLPSCQPVPVLHGEDDESIPGPFRADAWRKSRIAGQGTQYFPYLKSMEE